MVAIAAPMQKKYIQSRARLPNTGELQPTVGRSVCRCGGRRGEGEEDGGK